MARKQTPVQESKPTDKQPGRPAIEVSKTDLSIIEAMAKVGNRLDDIATALNISPSTLDRWLKLEDVDAAYRRGRAEAKHAMAARLWDIAMKDDNEGNPTKQALTATIFWLKAQANWTDRITVETKSEDANSQQVVIYLPDNNRTAA